MRAGNERCVMTEICTGDTSSLEMYIQDYLSHFMWRDLFHMEGSISQTHISQNCFTRSAFLLQFMVIQQSSLIDLDANLISVLSNWTKHPEEGEGHVPSIGLVGCFNP